MLALLRDKYWDDHETTAVLTVRTTTGTTVLISNGTTMFTSLNPHKICLTRLRSLIMKSIDAGLTFMSLKNVHHDLGIDLSSIDRAIMQLFKIQWDRTLKKGITPPEY